MHVRKDDKVIVISGKDKGTIGKVLKSFPKENRVIVENVNVRKKHVKATNQMQQAGIVEEACKIDASNVLLYCDTCKKGVRVGVKVDGDKKERYCKKCNATF